MDDEGVFGKVLHRLRFGEAIEQDLLSDYQVVVMFVDDEEVRDYVERGVFVQTDNGTVRDARTLAAQIGLAKAMRRFGLHRTVTFHSRVNLAARFATTLPGVIDWMPRENDRSGRSGPHMSQGRCRAGSETGSFAGWLPRMGQDGPCSPTPGASQKGSTCRPLTASSLSTRDGPRWMSCRQSAERSGRRRTRRPGRSCCPCPAVRR